MGKKGLKSRKRKEQTIAIIAVFSAILVIVGAILIFAASKNENLGNTEHDHDHDHENNSATVKELTLKVAVDAHEGTPHYNAAVKFEEQLEAKTGGKVKVEVYSRGKLGDNRTLLKALEENKSVVDIVIAPVSSFREMSGKVDMVTLPFMVENADNAWKFMEGNIQRELEAELLNKNIRVLTHYMGEMTCMVSSKKVINNASSITGMAFAETEKTTMSNVLQMMNARSVVMNSNMIYQALQQGQCDGYMGTLSDIYNNHLYQRQEYLAVTYHSYDGLAFAISDTTWKLLGEYQDEVQELAKSSAYTDKELVRQEEQKMLDHIKDSGVHILYPDMASFGEKAESYLRGQSSRYGTTMDKYLMDRKMQK